MDAESSQVATARVRKKRKCQDVDNSTADILISSAENPNRVPALRGKRKFGLLASLPSMPLDILFEILGHLKPYDILRLARTTKDFRRLLLSKSSLSIWKATLSNVPGLPHCPPGMSEPAWTNLVFSPYCHYCLTPIRKVQWIFRVRICSKCAKEHLFESSVLSYWLGFGVEIVVPTSPGKKGMPVYLDSDLALVKAQYAALKGDARGLFIEEQARTVYAIAEHAKLCQTWAKGQALDREQQLRQLREDRLTAITRKLEDLGWAEDIVGICRPDSLANHKLVDRPQLLTERIWTNIKPGILEFMAEMRDKRFKREFDAVVNRRKSSALNVLRNFKNARLPETKIMPQGPDFCHFSDISEVLKQTADVEVNESSFNDIIPRLPELVAEWRESIKQKMIQVLRMQNSNRGFRARFRFDMDLYMDADPHMDEEHMDEGSASPVDPNSQLTDDEISQNLILASTVFTCDCNDPSDSSHVYPSDDSDDEDYWPTQKLLFYPQVMGHICLTRVSKMFSWESSATADPSCRLESYGLERQQWSSSHLSLHPNASRSAKNIIQLAGLDPDLATSHQMDQLPIRFSCSACAWNISPEKDVANGDDDLALPVFDWRGAIIHQTNKHVMSSTLAKVSEDDFTPDIKEAESEYRAKFDYIWSCTHCRDLPKEPKANTLDGVKSHISRMHQIESPILNEDYFQHFAALDMRSCDMFPFYVRYSGGRFYIFDSKKSV